MCFFPGGRLGHQEIPLLSALHCPHRHTPQFKLPHLVSGGVEREREDEKSGKQKRREEEGIGRVSKEVLSFSRVLWKVKVCERREQGTSQLPRAGSVHQLQRRKALCGQGAAERRKSLDRGWSGMLHSPFCATHENTYSGNTVISWNIFKCKRKVHSKAKRNVTIIYIFSFCSTIYLKSLPIYDSAIFHCHLLIKG